jgi:hypothetical protein
MVAASTLGGPKPLYEGVYTVGEYVQGVYFPQHGWLHSHRIVANVVNLVGSFLLLCDCGFSGYSNDCVHFSYAEVGCNV